MRYPKALGIIALINIVLYAIMAILNQILVGAQIITVYIASTIIIYRFYSSQRYAKEKMTIHKKMLEALSKTDNPKDG